MERLGRVLSKPTIHLIWTAKYRRKVLLGPVEVRLLEVLKTTADRGGFVLLAARVHGGDHVHVFIFALPKLCIPELVCVLNCNCDRVLLLEFAQIKRQLWEDWLIKIPTVKSVAGADVSIVSGDEKSIYRDIDQGMKKELTSKRDQW